MICETLRADMITAVKSGDNPKRDILKLVLGEVELITARTGVLPNDDKVFQIIKKIVEANDQVLTHKFDDKLVTENSILKEYLPKMLTLDEIVKALPEDLVSQIKSSTPNDYGKMTGLVMKYLKGKGLSVDGNHVKLAILNIKG